MAPEFVIIAEDVVDEGLSLLLARGGGVPRLGIYNRVLDKKKYIHMSWAESSERSLHVKTGRVSSVDYPMELIHASVCRLITKAEQDLAIKALTWKGVQILGDLLHMPKAVRSEGECMLIPDAKKETLWLAYTPFSQPWRVRPCFFETPEERNILDASRKEGTPWSGIPLEDSVLPPTMRSCKVGKELQNTNSERWSSLLFPVAKAAVLGFSEWAPESAHPFGDALWNFPQKENARSPENLLELQQSGRYLLSRLIAYLRLYPILDNFQIAQPADSVKHSEEMLLKKKERHEMNISGRLFTVTRYHDEASLTAFGLIPKSRLPGELDRFYSMGDEQWESCLEVCSLGGQRDPQYTVSSIIRALETRSWFNRIDPFVAIGERCEKWRT